MENEENRGLIHKTTSEDYLVTFVSSVLQLSNYSLSLILLDTWIFLGEFLEGVACLDFWSKKAKEEQECARGYRY